MISADRHLPYFLERSKTQTIRLALYENGAIVEPDAGGVVSVHSANGESVVDAQTITITDGVAEYSVPDTAVPEAEAYSEDWRIVWTLAVDGVESTYALDAHLCRYVPVAVVSEKDIVADMHPELGKLLPAGQQTWAGFIDAAFVEIEQMLLELGRRPYLILNPWSLARVHRYKALERIFRALSVQAGPGGRFAALADHYRDTFKSEWGKLRFEYDLNEDGRKTGEAEDSQAGTPVIFLTSRG